MPETDYYRPSASDTALRNNSIDNENVFEEYITNLTYSPKDLFDLFKCNLFVQPCN